MSNPFLPVFDGTLEHLLPAGLTAAVTGWLGVVLLGVAGLAAVASDLLRQREPAADGGRHTRPVVPVARLRGALFGLAVAAALLAAFATLVRFSVLT